MKQASSEKKKRLPLACLVIYALTLISGILYFFFTKFPSFADGFNGTVAAFGRRALAFLTSWIPFSFAELLLILLPALIALLIFVAVKYFCGSRRASLTYLGMVVSGVCVIAILFVWCFAPGYYAPPLDQKLTLDRREVSAEELYKTAELLRGELETLVPEIVFSEGGASIMPYTRDEMNEKLMDAYASLSEKQDFIHHFDSRVKPVLMSVGMSYMHITGVYSFFTGEANINVDFPDYTIPYTAAHELAHQRGIAREDEANFVAFLACMESDDPYIRYSAYLNVYEYVVGKLVSANRELYKQNYSALPREILLERVAYSKFFDKYRENIAATVTEATNNAYLQSQGSVEGTRSYGMVVDLTVAYFRPYFE